MTNNSIVNNNCPVKYAFNGSASKVKEVIQSLMLERGNNHLNSPYGIYARCLKSESFLNAYFNVESDINDAMNFIFTNDLEDIIYLLPIMAENCFNTNNLYLKFDNDEYLLIITIFVDMDGLSASNRLTKFEDYFIENFGELFLDNILIDLEFQ